MMYYTIHCDALPGKEEDLDCFLGERAKPFWLSQPGVKSFHVYGDTLVGWPERTMVIEILDLVSLQRILNSEERKKLRKEFLTLTTDVRSQIVEELV